MARWLQPIQSRVKTDIGVKLMERPVKKTYYLKGATKWGKDSARIDKLLCDAHNRCCDKWERWMPTKDEIMEISTEVFGDEFFQWSLRVKLATAISKRLRGEE